MKKSCLLFGLLFCLSLFCSISVSVTNVQAQIVTADPVKSGSKISRWAAKVSEQCQKAMDWVANSKVGKFVGDGIKAAKNGIKFVKNKIKAAGTFYDNTVEAGKNSKAYKSALLSKDIVAAGKDLEVYASQSLKIKDDSDKRIANLKKTYEGKINALKSNASVEADYAKQTGIGGANNLKNDGEIKMLEAKLAGEIAKERLSLVNALDDVEAQVSKKTSKVTRLTQELADLNKVNIKISNPLESIDKAKEDMFLAKDEVPSIKNKKNKETSRYQIRREVIYKVYEKSMQDKLTLEDKRSEVEDIADLVATMQGTSDASGIISEVLVKQAEYLKYYVSYVVADLKQESTVELTTFQVLDAQGTDKKGKFNLNDYKYTPKKKSLINGIKDSVGSAKNAINSTKNSVGSAVNKAAAVKDSATQKINEAKEMKEGLGDVADSVKELSKNPDAMKGMM